MIEALGGAAAEATTRCAAGDMVLSIIAKEVPWLWQSFGVADGALIISSAVQFAAYTHTLGKDCSARVAAAAVLGLSIKMSRTNSQHSEVEAAWVRVAGKSLRKHVVKAERQMAAAWGRDSTEAEYFA